MSKILNINSYSLNIKVTIALFILAIFLFTILFLLIVPKMQKEQYNHTKSQVEQMINLTKEQMHVAGKAISMQSELEKKETKFKIEAELYKLKYKIDTNKNITKNNINKVIKENILNEECKVGIRNKEQIKNIETHKWLYKTIDDKENIFNRKVKLVSYTVNLKTDDLYLTTSCMLSIFNKNHHSFEKSLKENIQKSFSLTHNIHKGKIYLVWINKKLRNDTSVLYTTNKEEINEKYSISRISNVKNIMTGKLSAKEIIDFKDKDPIIHQLHGKEAMTWVKEIYEADEEFFFLITTAYKKDFYNNIDSAFWKILPASIITLFLSILAGFFLFKQLFKKLEDSVEEKETLLKEIHHRVKNNLALTISLIKLQSAKIKDKNTKSVLKDVQERIYTMELLHRKLYESTNLNLIPFKEYIPKLTSDILDTYKNEKEISLEFDIEDIYMDIQTAMPCGLILNELITNSFKYAFEDIENPNLKISMFKKEKKYHIYIKDNGKGLDSSININQTNTLGLKLINSITKLQLKGNLNYSYENGAKFHIVF